MVLYYKFLNWSQFSGEKINMKIGHLIAEILSKIGDLFFLGHPVLLHDTVQCTVVYTVAIAYFVLQIIGEHTSILTPWWIFTQASIRVEFLSVVNKRGTLVQFWVSYIVICKIKIEKSSAWKSLKSLNINIFWENDGFLTIKGFINVLKCHHWWCGMVNNRA